MTAISSSFLLSMSNLSFQWPEWAMLSVLVVAITRLLFNGRAMHAPIFLVAIATAAACGVKLTQPGLWTQEVYIGFELGAGLCALYIARADRHTRVGYLLGFAGAGAWAILRCVGDGACEGNYAWLGAADLCAAIVVTDGRPRDQVETLAQWGVGTLLAFQALRAALFGVDERLALAVGQAGWAVHCLAFLLIAHAARR